MPKYVPDGSMRVDRYRKVKTFGDKLKELLEGLAGAGVIVVILILIFG